ncbi:MAG: OB-fold domain-containing protein [Chloroflexi bacterium]|nr:OB-fold domain-containing protein [Chloroflexota bacterium]
MPAINEPIYQVAVQSTAKAWRERFGRYRLMGTVCNDCGTHFYPRRPVCARCRSRNVADKQLPHTGTVVAHCVDNFALSGYGQQVPIACVAIQLDGMAPVIMSHVVDIDPWQVKIGDRVEMVVRRVRRESNGNYQYSHKFRLIGK